MLRQWPRALSTFDNPTCLALSREESGRDSGEFGKLCSRHRYPAQRDVLSWHWDTRYGAPWVFVVNILYTHTPPPSPGSRRGRRVLCRGTRRSEGGGGSSKKRGRGRERESEARRYLRRIILHYVPKRRTNAVLIYASPRGDKRKARYGVSRAGNQLFFPKAPRRDNARIT